MENLTIPTWAEVNCMVVLGLAALVFILVAWIKGRDEDGYVDWIRDWDEYR